MEVDQDGTPAEEYAECRLGLEVATPGIFDDNVRWILGHWIPLSFGVDKVDWECRDLTECGLQSRNDYQTFGSGTD